MRQEKISTSIYFKSKRLRPAEYSLFLTSTIRIYPEIWTVIFDYLTPKDSFNLSGLSKEFYHFIKKTSFETLRMTPLKSIFSYVKPNSEELIKNHDNFHQFFNAITTCNFKNKIKNRLKKDLEFTLNSIFCISALILTSICLGEILWIVLKLGSEPTSLDGKGRTIVSKIIMTQMIAFFLTLFTLLLTVPTANPNFIPNRVLFHVCRARGIFFPMTLEKVPEKNLLRYEDIFAEFPISQASYSDDDHFTLEINTH